MSQTDYDVAVIGGSNAGLAAALSLGRSNRQTIVFDTGSPRNKRASQAHNFFTRDGMPPEALLATGKKQLLPYTSVRLHSTKVTAAQKNDDRFLLDAEDGVSYTVRKVILATGVTDVLMDIRGMRELWGKKIFSCPYCHGWEIKDQSVAVIASGFIIYDLAVTLSNWNKDMIFLVNGTPVPDDKKKLLFAKGWQIIHTPISELIDDGDKICIRFSDGTEIIRAAAYSKPAELRFNNQLAKQLGCGLHESGPVQTDGGFQTTVAGVFAAGDLTHPGFHQVSSAAAGGHMAAMMCNNQLCREDFENRHAVAGTPSGK